MLQMTSLFMLLCLLYGNMFIFNITLLQSSKNTWNTWGTRTSFCISKFSPLVIIIHYSFYLQYIDNINTHLDICLLLILGNYKAQRTPGTRGTPVFATLPKPKQYLARLFWEISYRRYVLFGEIFIFGGKWRLQQHSFFACYWDRSTTVYSN